jgi:hypothetical protein
VGQDDPVLEQWVMATLLTLEEQEVAGRPLDEALPGVSGG